MEGIKKRERCFRVSILGSDYGYFYQEFAHGFFHNYLNDFRNKNHSQTLLIYIYIISSWQNEKRPRREGYTMSEILLGFLLILLIIRQLDNGNNRDKE